jgi:hypothetical protein
VKDEGDVENRDVGHEDEPASQQPARPHVSDHPQANIDGAATPADLRRADQQKDPEQKVRNQERNQRSPLVRARELDGGPEPPLARFLDQPVYERAGILDQLSVEPHPRVLDSGHERAVSRHVDLDARQPH